MICAGSPWDGVTVLHLTQPPDYQYGNTDADSDHPGLPWAVELADGDLCTFIQGATGAVGDRRINYGCQSGIVILGDLDVGDGIRVYGALIDDESNAESRWVQVRRTWN